MINVELARRLAAAGLQWTPAAGDRFVIPRPDLADQVFMVAEMVVEVDRVGHHGVVKFNGTTEWALDSIAQSEVVWLPREDQLREALGGAFQALTRVHDTWIVTLETGRGESRSSGADPETCYGRALLSLLDGPRPGPAPTAQPL